MAFGFSSKYIQDIALDNLTSEQFLVLTIEAAKKLDWNVGYTSENGFIAFTKFSMSSWSEEVKVEIDGNTAKLKSECTGSQMVDWGKNKENIKNLISKFNELKNSFTPEELAEKYEELKPNLTSKEQDVLSQQPPTTKEKITSVFAIFKPTQGYFITPIIIDLNIVLFILMVITGVNFMFPDNESLLKWGANFRPLTMEGEWWRLITNCFLHIGIIHILMNMYALLYIGLLLEPRIGKIKFAASYIITGITASIASLWWHDLTISAGASGAIFGLYGVFLALLATNLIEKAARQALITSIGIFVVYNLLNGMKGGIDNAAHIGGLIGGLIIGFSFYPALVNPESKTRNFIISSATLGGILIFSILMISKTSNIVGKYDMIMNKFAEIEQKAMSLYRIPQSSSDNKYLRVIKEEGIPNWKECQKQVNKIDSLENLPAELVSKSVLLKKYCNYRIKSFELIAESIDRHTHAFDEQIGIYNTKIDLIIRKLNGETIADSLINIKSVLDLVPNLPKDVLYVVDGRPVDDISIIKPEDVKLVVFLNPEASFQLYGEKGKEGSLMIETK
jgi:rhomboid protease GluP